MCEECVKAVKEFYPDLPEDEVGALLMNATAFPMGSPERVRAQLKEVREATDGSLEQAICYADMKLDEEMKKYQEQQKSD